MHQDKQLLESYRRGETSAYEQIYRLYAEPVRRFLNGGFTFVSKGRTCRYRGAASGIDSEAIVQETFARAYSESTRRNYDGERPFRNYLFSIAKNLVLREFQRRERVLSIDQTDETTDALAHRGIESGLSMPGASPEGSVADEQLRTVTQQFIDELDEEETLFFSYRFAQGQTQEATAISMAVTRARVKLLEKNIRRRFLDRLRDHGYFVGYTPKPRWTRAGEEQVA